MQPGSPSVSRLQRAAFFFSGIITLGIGFGCTRFEALGPARLGSRSLTSLSGAVSLASGSVMTVSSCQKITEPGTYVLSADLTSALPGLDYCLDVKSVSDLHIDCAGHMINVPTLSAIGFSMVQNSSISNCVIPTTHPISVRFSSGVTLKGNKIGSASTNTLSILTIDLSDNVIFSENTAYVILQVNASSQVSVLNNTLVSPWHGPNNVIPGVVYISSAGTGNVVRGNTIDGLAGLAQADGGSDDGILFIDQTDLVIDNNLVKNNWDAGIEGVGANVNVTITSNRIDGVGYVAIGGWYGNIFHMGQFTMKNAVISNNTASHSNDLFSFTEFHPGTASSDAQAGRFCPQYQLSGNRLVADQPLTPPSGPSPTAPTPSAGTPPPSSTPPPAVDHTAEIQSQYYVYLPGCLTSDRLVYWQDWFTHPGATSADFVTTLQNVSSPNVIAGCQNWGDLSGTITFLYNRYLPGCLNQVRLNYWLDWFTHPGASGADFIWTLQNAATPAQLAACAAGG